VWLRVRAESGEGALKASLNGRPIELQFSRARRGVGSLLASPNIDAIAYLPGR
jgi:hypothetical protein